VALATGIGISAPAATYMRAVLVVLCVASLVFMTARRLLVRRPIETEHNWQRLLRHHDHYGTDEFTDRD
jgi:hypothetical protein